MNKIERVLIHPSMCEVVPSADTALVWDCWQKMDTTHLIPADNFQMLYDKSIWDWIDPETGEYLIGPELSIGGRETSCCIASFIFGNAVFNPRVLRGEVHLNVVQEAIHPYPADIMETIERAGREFGIFVTLASLWEMPEIAGYTYNTYRQQIFARWEQGFQGFTQSTYPV